MPQQTHPSWFDWATVAAIVLGPVLALFAQRVLDWLREKKNRRVNLYLTAMSLRGTWLHPDSVRALNSIDTIFAKETDRPIRDAWERVIKHASTQRPDMQAQPDEARLWDTRLWDLRIDLYQLLGAAVGYNYTIDYIKNQLYVPKHYVDAEIELIAIRQKLAKVITDDGLRVTVRQP